MSDHQVWTGEVQPPSERTPCASDEHVVNRDPKSGPDYCEVCLWELEPITHNAVRPL